MRQGAGDPGLVQVCGAGLDIAGMCLQPLMVSASDPVTEDVNRLGLAGEAGGQLLGDEAVGAAVQRQAALDRVVIGDRHEVHPAALGELVDVLGGRRALRQPKRPLHAELGDHRRGGVAVQVDPAGRGGGHRRSLFGC